MKSLKEPGVSALIPTYNRARHVLRAIESVMSQTTPVDEIVVVDDGSTDGTADLIEARYGAKVRLIRQKNTGVSGARRRLVEEARQEWVAFLDSDDIWTPGRNREMGRLASAVPADVAWIFGDIQLIADSGPGATLFALHGLTITGDSEVFADTWRVHHPFQFGMLQGSLIRRAALLEVDCFGEGLRHSEDFLVGVQVALRHRFAAIPSIVTNLYRTSDLSASSLDRNEGAGPDYSRARVAAYGLAAAADRSRPWAGLHSHYVRTSCKSLSAAGQRPFKMSLEQFRFGISTKAILFSAACLVGRHGIRIWDGVGEAARRLSSDAGSTGEKLDHATS